jgi:predicted AAA+ superfamily ATPase
MDYQAMSTVNTSFYTKVQFFQRQAASLLLYQSVLQGEVPIAFLDLLQSIRYSDADGRNCLQAYGNYFQALAASKQTWEEYLICQILIADNPFTRLAQQRAFADLPTALVAAAQHDLQILQNLYDCNSAILSEWVQFVAHLPVSPVVWYQESESIEIDTDFISSFLQLETWADAVESLVPYYQQYGTGLFAQYRAFRWQNGNLTGILYPAPVKLDTLLGYEWQKDTLLKNPKFLLSGQPALHLLLYGSGGYGKSSLVKSLLHENGHKNLRLIEVTKPELKNLPQIIEQLRGIPQKFIIFVDDLSLQEDNDAFKVLKVVLEGSLTDRPQNVVIYATSNCHHLIREYFNDRPTPKNDEEVHAWDTMQERLSFSDHFGLTLTFESADQKTYLQIVQRLAAQVDLNLNQEDLEYKALQWASRHNGRSGRTAQQFIDFLKADLSVDRENKNSL